MTDKKTRTKDKAKPRHKKTTGRIKKPKTPVVKGVRKEIRLDGFTKGLLEKLVTADTKKGKSSTESSIIREAIHKYYVEKENKEE